MLEDKIKDARDFLKSEGYYVDNLWHIDDVKQNYNCTDEQAYQVLNNTLQNQGTIEDIFYRIDIICDELKIEENASI